MAAEPFLPGFDPRWRSPEDFILGITKEIWEDRHIDRLLHYYAPDLIVRSPASIVHGNRGIIAATQNTLAEFPDRELPGEDVIWTDAGPEAFLSSHRLICTATHSAPGAYGPPSGRRVSYRILADCFCRANAVHDEWLIRDQAAIVAQMGADPKDWTRAQIAREGGPEACVKPFTPARDVPGPYRGAGNDHPLGLQLADHLTTLISADLSVIPRHWDRACHLHYPGHVEAHGHAAADRFWLSLRAALPSASFAVHTTIGRTDPLNPPRAAVRWSLDGAHGGYGRFGAPSGAPLHVMGMTHAEFGPRGLRREWTLIDDTAVWRQILLHTGEV